MNGWKFKNPNPYRVAVWTLLFLLIGVMVAYTSAQIVIEKEVRLAVRKAGRDYGASHPDRDCVMAALLSVQDRRNTAPIPKVDQFLSGCLEVAKGKRLFCNSVPAKNNFIAGVYWRVKIAETFSCSEPGCDQVFAAVQRYCHNRFQSAPDALFIGPPRRGPQISTPNS